MSIYGNKKAKAPEAGQGPAVPGNAEAEALEELDAVQLGFRERLKAEEKRRRAATDSEFWFAVCFKSREEKEAFLKEWKLFRHGDKYLSGDVVNTILKKRLNESKE